MVNWRRFTPPVSSMNDKQQTLSEEGIDELVTAQAGDDSAWEKPTRPAPRGETASEILSDTPIPSNV
jgi:hypothetical protein